MFVQQYLATVTVFAGNFAPVGWRFCDGSLISIAENNALFALIGTTYGGDGITTFALPDFRSRIAVHPGSGQVIGMVSGTESVIMTLNSLPSHTHVATAFSGGQPVNVTIAGQNTPLGNYPAPAPGSLYNASADGSGLIPSAGNTITVITGSNQPIETLQPYLAMNYIIATEGIFPSQG